VNANYFIAYIHIACGDEDYKEPLRKICLIAKEGWTEDGFGQVENFKAIFMSTDWNVFSSSRQEEFYLWMRTKGMEEVVVATGAHVMSWRGCFVKGVSGSF